MTLRLRFWGTRGSIPTPGPHTVRHGGNTPCVEVRTDTEWLIILDAGTGIRELGRSLMRAKPAPAGGRAGEEGVDGRGGGIAGDIFLTHAHWDHIQGIPFFAPIFQAGNRFTIWTGGLQAEAASVDRVIREQMSPVVFPVKFEELNARVAFCQIGTERRSENGYTVKTMGVHHPGGAVGYRLSGDGKAGSGKAEAPSFVYISDNELGAHERYGTDGGWRDELVAFVRGARLLVHDATYTTEEYARHRGWGHSTFDDAVALALDAEVEELVLFHHKPERSDDELDRCVAACWSQVDRRGARLRVTAAAEGMTRSV
jgi:phosphoribosyl 1,2-cyclic phosphodiesterase